MYNEIADCFEYTKEFYAHSKKKIPFMNRAIRQFEASHPHLTLIHAEEGAINNVILSEDSYVDTGLKVVVCPKFEYLSYHQTRWYEMDTDLEAWLVQIDKEFVPWMKKQKERLAKRKICHHEFVRMLGGNYRCRGCGKDRMRWRK